MWGRRPEHRNKRSLQRSLCCTCFTFICWLMRLNACLIEFISIQILLGASASGDTVTTVFMDSPVLQFVLNYCCSILQQRGTRLQTVPGIALVLTVKEVIAGNAHNAEVRMVTLTFHWRSLPLTPSISPHWFYCDYLFLHKPPKRNKKRRKMALVRGPYSQKSFIHITHVV